MNDFDWMQEVMVLADDIADHKRGSTRFFTDPIRTLRTFLETTPYMTQDGDALPIDIDTAIEKIKIRARLDTKAIMDIVVQAISKSCASPKIDKQGCNLSVFKGMAPSEVTLEFAPDMRLNITAGSEKKSGHCRDLKLINIRTGKLNNQGALLLEHCTSQTCIPKSGPNASSMRAIRRIFKTKLGINANPFSKDWIPHFKVIDSRDRADVRAKSKALRVQKALKMRQEASREQEDDNDYDPYDPEQYSASERSDDGSPEVDLNALLLEKLDSGVISQDKYDQMASDVKKGKKTPDEFAEWVKSFQ